MTPSLSFGRGALRIPAADIETIVVDAVRDLLCDPNRIVIEHAIALRRRGREQRLILTAAATPSHAEPDAAMVKAILRARIWFAALKERRVDSIAELGRRENVARAIISHHLALAFLAPDITKAVMQGHQPIGLTIERLIAIAAASPIWDRQRAMLRVG